MRAATVVQVLQDVYMFYCMFYFTCDHSFSGLPIRSSLNCWSVVVNVQQVNDRGRWKCTWNVVNTYTNRIRCFFCCWIIFVCYLKHSRRNFFLLDPDRLFVAQGRLLYDPFSIIEASWCRNYSVVARKNFQRKSVRGKRVHLRREQNDDDGSIELDYSLEGLGSVAS